MSEVNYKPNSHKSKEEASEKKVEKVITGQARIKKKTEIQKFADAFISEDVSNVKSYICKDVLVPAIKKLVTDIIKDSIDMILYGEVRGGDKRSRVDRVSYNKYYDRRDDDRNSSRNDARSNYDYTNITFDTRAEAEAVRSSLDDIIDTYNVVRVADLYDLIGETCPFTENDYGWYNIRNAEIIRVRDGYMLKMPRALPIR